jgi:hypothetical protein
VALLKILGLMRSRQPITPETAIRLRTLLLYQMSVFLACIILFYIMTRIDSAKATSTYILGFGMGWIVCIRYYVWRHVG